MFGSIPALATRARALTCAFSGGVSTPCDEARAMRDAASAPTSAARAPRFAPRVDRARAASPRRESESIASSRSADADRRRDGVGRDATSATRHRATRPMARDDAAPASGDARLACVDFDLTVLARHSFAERVTVERVEALELRDVEREFVDVECFRAFLGATRDEEARPEIRSRGRARARTTDDDDGRDDDDETTDGRDDGAGDRVRESTRDGCENNEFWQV
jgi:hypothetical protein